MNEKETKIQTALGLLEKWEVSVFKEVEEGCFPDSENRIESVTVFALDPSAALTGAMDKFTELDARDIARRAVWANWQISEDFYDGPIYSVIEPRENGIIILIYLTDLHGSYVEMREGAPGKVWQF